MTKDCQPNHSEPVSPDVPYSQDVHDFLALEQLRRQPDATNKTRNTLWFVQETLIHRMKRDEHQQLFSALGELRRQRSRTNSPGQEASRA
jgi:hypothetical protein